MNDNRQIRAPATSLPSPSDEYTPLDLAMRVRRGPTEIVRKIRLGVLRAGNCQGRWYFNADQFQDALDHFAEIDAKRARRNA